MAGPAGRRQALDFDIYTDKVIPVLSKNFAIHTLGHVPTFATPLRHVWKAAITRHSAPNVDKAAMIGPSPRGR